MANNANTNKAFLAAIDEPSRNQILESIAAHYGVSKDEIVEEVTQDEAEHLLDYMVEPNRSVAFALMKRHGFWKHDAA